MGVRNVAASKLFCKKERFADVFNSRVFYGRQVIKPEELELLESESDILLKDKSDQTNGYQRYRDIVMRWRGKIDFAILACEVQDSIHYLMPVRNMVYDGLSYTDQADLLWEEHQRQGEKPTKEEFLSRFYQKDKLIPVITVVFYYGEHKWNGPVNLYDMFDVENEDLKGILEEYVPNYWINLIDIKNTQIEYHFETDLQIISDMLKYRKNKSKMIDCINKNKSYFSNIDADTYLALEVFLNLTNNMKKQITTQDGEERFDVCEALLEYYQDGVNEGIEKGFIQGTVELVQEFGETKEYAVLKVMKRFGMNRAAAVTNVDLYWS